MTGYAVSLQFIALFRSSLFLWVYYEESDVYVLYDGWFIFDTT